MNKRRHSALWLRFAFLIFATIFSVFVFITLLWLILSHLNVNVVPPSARRIPLLLFAVGSLLLGSVFAFYVGKLILRPLQNISDAFDELSKGNFSVKVSEHENFPEIREMAQHFNAMTYDLSHIETLRSDFVANVSHEFKTPIAAIEGYATLLQNRSLSPERHDLYVQKILDNSRRLSKLSGNILMLSKLENQETVPGRCEFRLDEQLRRCILLLEDKWSAKQIEWDLALPRQLCFGSEELLEQVWINLLDNAIKHSPERAVISVTLTEAEQSLITTITDHGEGMSPEVQNHIFEKFYQGDTSHRSEGNGLGLALVKRIVELCGGEIQVSSRPEAGSTFFLKLPVLNSLLL